MLQQSRDIGAVFVDRRLRRIFLPFGGFGRSARDDPSGLIENRRFISQEFLLLLLKLFLTFLFLLNEILGRIVGYFANILGQDRHKGRGISPHTNDARLKHIPVSGIADVRHGAPLRDHHVRSVIRHTPDEELIILDGRYLRADDKGRPTVVRVCISEPLNDKVGRARKSHKDIAKLVEHNDALHVLPVVRGIERAIEGRLGVELRGEPVAFLFKLCDFLVKFDEIFRIPAPREISERPNQNEVQDEHEHIVGRLGFLVRMTKVDLRLGLRTFRENHAQKGGVTTRIFRLVALHSDARQPERIDVVDVDARLDKQRRKFRGGRIHFGFGGRLPLRSARLFFVVDVNADLTWERFSGKVYRLIDFRAFREIVDSDDERARDFLLNALGAIFRGRVNLQFEGAEIENVFSKTER